MASLSLFVWEYKDASIIMLLTDSGCISMALRMYSTAFSLSPFF